MANKSNNKNKSFYPKLIISNIGIILSVNYITLLIITLLVNPLFSVRIHRHQLLGYSQFDFLSNYTYSSLFIELIHSIVLLSLFIGFVEKANKILDYALTNFVIQVLICWIFEGFPYLFNYWIINFVKLFIVVIVAEYVKLKIESQEIKLHLNFLSGHI